MYTSTCNKSPLANLHFQGENITGLATITGLCPQSDIILRVCISSIYIISKKHYGLFFQIRPAINETDGPWWRPVPNSKDCLVSLPVVPPDPVQVESVGLAQDTPLEWCLADDGDRWFVNLSLSWEPPSITYGEIRRYDVYVGQLVLVGSDPTPSAFSTVSHFSDYNH